MLNKNYIFLICLSIIIITFTSYNQVLKYGFISFDDELYITKNQQVQSGISLQNIRWAFSLNHKENLYWHPLAWISHMIDCQLYGLNATIHHLHNLIIHVLNSILLFFIFKRMTGMLWQSAFIAILFAVHPINVESVAWIAERKNVLSTFFWLLTILFYVHYHIKTNLLCYILSIVSLALGLMVKPMLVTIPFVLLLLDFWPLKRFCPSKIEKSIILPLIIEKFPFLLLALSLIIFILSLASGNAVELIPLKIRIQNVLISYLSYIFKIVYPKDLAVFYPYLKSITIWQSLGSLFVLMLISAFAIYKHKSSPYFLVGWLWFIGTFVPVIGIVHTGIWPAIADRHAYIPSIGLFIIVGWGITEFVQKWPYKNALLAIASVALILILIGLTRDQVRYWNNSISLFERAIQVTKNNYIIHIELGDVLIEHGRLNEAINNYIKALKIKPKLKEAHNNLGYALSQQDKLSEAINHYFQAIQIDPDFKEAYNNLGLALTNQGKTHEAIQYYSKALNIDPNFIAARYNLGIALYQQGKLKEATNHFSMILNKSPDNVQAINNLAAIAYKQKNYKKAAFYFQKALHLNSNDNIIFKNFQKTLSKIKTEQ